MLKAQADAASRGGPQWLHAAIELYGVALGSPSSPQERAVMHANRALCQLRAGDAAAALHEAEAATEAAPLWPKAWVRKAAALLTLGDRDGARGAAARAAALGPEDAALLLLQTELQAELQTEASPPSPAHWETRSAAVAAVIATAEGDAVQAMLSRHNLRWRQQRHKEATAAAAAVPAAEAAAWGASFAKGRASRRPAETTPVAWYEGGLGSTLCSALSQSHWSRQLIAPLALYGVLLSWGWL